MTNPPLPETVIEGPTRQLAAWASHLNLADIPERVRELRHARSQAADRRVAIRTLEREDSDAMR